MIAFAADAIDAATIRRQLSAIEALIAAATRQHRAELSRLEGQRDRLLLMLTDLDGAHDRRFVAVR
jgi:hypothetical protein